MIFEYKTVVTETAIVAHVHHDYAKGLEDLLNKHAKDGWWLCAETTFHGRGGHDTTILILERANHDGD